MAHIRNLLTDMESSFISIFLDAACRVAEVAESKLFVLLESTDGLRRVGGDKDLLNSFFAGKIGPQVADHVLRRPSKTDELTKSSVILEEQPEEEEESYGLYFKEEGRDRRHDGIEIASELKSYKHDLNGSKRKSSVNEHPPAKKIRCDDSNDVVLMGDVADDDDDDYRGNPTSTVTEVDDLEEGSEEINNGNEGNNDGDQTPTPECWDDRSLKRSSPEPRTSTTAFAIKKALTTNGALTTKESLTTKRDLKCHICPPHLARVWKRWDGLRRNIQASHERRIVCPDCDRGFATKWYLKKHKNKKQCYPRLAPVRKKCPFCPADSETIYTNEEFSMHNKLLHSE